MDRRNLGKARSRASAATAYRLTGVFYNASVRAAMLTEPENLDDFCPAWLRLHTNSIIRPDWISKN